jgi:hypothetical protein
MRIRTAQKFINFYAMKKVHKFLLRSVASLFALAFNPVVNAQDDLYFNPATDASAPTVAKYTEEYDANNNVTRTYNDNDEYYEDDNDYAYEYSSRIRRFQHHAVVVDYYDPFYIDLYNYDPFYSPGTSIYVYNYNDYWSYRQWRRYQRWNSWDNYNYRFGGGWNSWGWQSSYSYNTPWYNPWVVNNYYYDPYWTCNGYNPYYQNNYYGNGWSNDHYYYNSHNGNGGNSSGYSPKTYTGPRRHGSNVNPGYARITDSKGRLATAENNVPTIEKTAARPGRTVDDIEGNTAVGRGKTASDRSAAPSAGGRRPQGSTTEPLSRTRNSEVPTGRNVETPAPRTNDGYQPRRLETAPAPRTNEGYKPRGTETPTRRSDNESGSISPRRSAPAPTRTEESRPVRRTEERSYERPTRTNNNGGGSSSQESHPIRSSDSGNSTRSSNGGNSGSSTRSSDSGSSKNSGNSSGRSSSGGGHGGRN